MSTVFRYFNSSGQADFANWDDSDFLDVSQTGKGFVEIGKIGGSSCYNDACKQLVAVT